MRGLRGKVAVVTGSAGGIGRALCEEFLAEGMKVVVADLRTDEVEQTAKDLGALGDVLGVATDVSNWESVVELADATYDRFGACHVLVNNAGVGDPSAKPWENTVNDWRWLMGVNVMGVAHGSLAFVPRMIEGGEEGHVINTSSGNGGIAPLPTAAVYAASKAAVTTYTECLASQLLSEGTKLRASIFYPSGGLLKTGLWTSDRNRPAELARERPRTTEAMTVERLEEQAAKGGYQLPWQDLNELARLVIQGIKDERFIIMVGVESIGSTMRERAEAFEKGDLPIRKPGMLG
jgi:NAD(P)-dependent dehydrogenase (short-subunit alcohol dehydrogenase family)